MRKIILVSSIIIILLLLCSLSVSAETEGDYTYTVSNDEATITDFNSNYSGNLTIPSILGGYPVKYIDNKAFCECYNLTSIIMPNSITSIGHHAFYDCRRLKSVTIPNSVTSIGYCAFLLCEALTQVNISDITAWCNIEFSDTYANPLGYPGKLYLNGSLITDLIIPNDVTSIGNYAFHYYRFKSIDIPNSVVSIGDNAFWDCDSLASITIPNSVTSIGNYAFYGCDNLRTVYASKSHKWQYDFGANVQMIYICQVKFIGDYEDTQTKIQGEYITLSTPPTGYTYSYTVNGKAWDGSEPITEDITVTVTKVISSYKVKFVGDYVDEQTIQYNGYATLPAECGYTYSYTANGKDWNNEPITADITITVTKTPIIYQVTFIGDYEDTQTVEYGKNAILPTAPKYSKYTFTIDGNPWDGKNITDNVTVNVKLTEFEVSPQYCFNDDSKCYYKFNLKSSNDFDATVIIALYDINGKLLDTLSKDASLTSTYQSITAKPSVTDAVEYKVFLWENLQTMTPVCEAFFGNVEN